MSSLPGSRGTTPTVGDMAGVGGARSLGWQRCLVTNGPGPWHTVLLDACHRGYRFRSDGGGGASFSDTSALLPPHAPRGRGVGAVPRPRHCRVSWGLGSHQTAPADTIPALPPPPPPRVPAHPPPDAPIGGALTRSQAEEPLLGYRCPTCTFKGRYKGTFSLLQDADSSRKYKLIRPL